MLLLEEGDRVRYQGLGAGCVVRQENRHFQGRDCVFAVISFPHRDMTVQLPLGDPLVMRRLCKIISKTACQRLLRSLKEPGGTLARTWDQREESGSEVLQRGEPADWTTLLRCYVRARNEGLMLAASDMDIVRACIELLSAEMAAACDLPYDEALAQVTRAYRGNLKSAWQEPSKGSAEVLVEA
jgi:RNA polymerase-interacting CarD/CdnL/TRCF family regulator